jgi:hypothetical protein
MHLMTVAIMLASVVSAVATAIAAMSAYHTAYAPPSPIVVHAAAPVVNIAPVLAAPSAVGTGVEGRPLPRK